MEIKVTYKKWMGILLVVCSVLIFVMSAMVGFGMQTVSAVICLPMGILYLLNPAMVYNDHEIRIKGLFGNVIGVVPISAQVITVDEGGYIYAQGKRIKVARWLIHSGEYTALLQHIHEKITTNT